MKEIKNFKRVLVANRDEIAIRIFRACKERAEIGRASCRERV